VLIDNCSTDPLAGRVDLSWHPHAKVLREEKLGLTNARLCGINNAAGEIIVFIDDDNLLDAEYLSEAARIGASYGMLGAWGGQQIPIFLSPPDEQIHQHFMDILACRTFDCACWTNASTRIEATPHGAGMCIRRSVAKRYVDVLATDPLRRSLDRTGTILLGCGDHDMAYISCDMGLGVGVFPSLLLQHLMPPERLKQKYLLRLVEGGSYSAALLGYCRNQKLPSTLSNSPAKILWFWLRTWHLPRMQRKRIAAEIRGKRRAIETLRRFEADKRASAVTRD
jgi:glycosyltransferase involved in cell wall biosynthesis